MAGFSGSNGGISPSLKKVESYSTFINDFRSKVRLSYVDYFVNNQCNINCKHCYVGYKKTHNSNTLQDWISVFDELIRVGAKTFGNVGKEPLLSWGLTNKLLHYFKYQRDKEKEIRFGIVTNGLLFNDTIIKELKKTQPNYIDISLDGDKYAHEQIRGNGTYDKLYQNLMLLSKTNLTPSVWISFTLNKINQNSLSTVIKTCQELGFMNILISPYITLDKKDDLYLCDEEIISIIKQFLVGKVIDFNEYQNLNIYFKHDFVTSGNLMFKLQEKGIIDLENLYLDDYEILLNQCLLKNNNRIIFNYIPFDISFKQIIRISHDGYVSNCFDMFYDNYPERTIGNVKNQDIREILSNIKQKIETKELFYV